MSDYGVTPEGFKLKPREVITEDLKSRAKNLFGNDINLDTDSPLGKFIQLISWELSKNWHSLEKIYNSHYVNSASNQSLNDIHRVPLFPFR